MIKLKSLAMVFLTGLGSAALSGGLAASEDPAPKPRKPNRLIHEKSPYLLQHAHNPVDWYPWGEEAFRAARAGKKPIFLSIGYSTCHWCHVMERESFENEAIAAFLNEHFIPIKVDREERPDVDEVYMKALIAYSGSGGWPLSAFLTPEGKPFFLGSYFPPEDHPQRGSGFRALLEGVRDAWRGRREKVLESAERLSAHLSSNGGPLAAAESWSLDQLKGGAQEILATYDGAYGGFARPPRYAPKFPRSSTLDFLLAYHRLAGEKEALRMAIDTLKRMAQGGIRDHLGGGFHRYSTDRQWLVPHFEKMLYDNALLACTYLEAFRSTGEPLFLEVAREALEYLLQRLRDPAGGFCSAEDADSEGVEGKYYVFNRREILAALGEPEGGLFISRFGVTEPGNFESAGDNVLHQAVSLEELAAREQKDLAAVAASLEASRRKLLARRDQRVPPLKDDKVLADWNGLAISAFSRAYQATGEERWLEAARGAADFVLKSLQRDGKLLHRWRAGQADYPAYLEDYAFFAHGLLDLQEASLDLESLKEARRLAFEMIRQFWDEKNGGFFQTGPQHERLLVRAKDFYDGALPSGNAVAAAVLLRLAAYTEEPELVEKAGVMARIGAALFKQGAEAHPQMLAAAAHSFLPRAQAVLAAPKLNAAARALLREWGRGYRPNKRVVGVTPENRQEVMGLCPWVRKAPIPEKLERPVLIK